MFDALDLEQLLGRLSVLESWRDSVPRARAIEDADPVNWLRVKNAEAELEIPARSLVEVMLLNKLIQQIFVLFFPNAF